MNVFIALAMMLVTACQERHFSLEESVVSGHVIYGHDNRVEVKDYPERRVQEYAAAVAIMTYSWSLSAHPHDDQYLYYQKTPAYENYHLCEDDAYTTQGSLSHCSAFLVTQDTVITAGHCLNHQEHCRRMSFIFNYTDDNGMVKASDVYRCQQVIESGVNQEHYADYSVIKLDRAVSTARPLTVKTTGVSEVGTPLVMIGSPFGIPLKVVDQATISSETSLLTSLLREAAQAGEVDETLDLNPNAYFMANLDSFSGNSGSPVINQKTGVVEGIFSYGAADWYFDPHQYCFRNIKKEENSPVEELIYKTSHVPFLKELRVTAGP